MDPLGNYCGITNKSKIKYTDEDMSIGEGSASSYVLNLTDVSGLKRMDLAVQSGKPWWVSIGNHRPHTHYRVPQGFYGTELYPGDLVKPPKHPGFPV